MEFTEVESNMARGMQCQIPWMSGSQAKEMLQNLHDNVWYAETNLQIRCLPPKAGEEGGNYLARPVHLHVLWQEHGQEAFRGHLELQGLRQDRRWWCMDCLTLWTSEYQTLLPHNLPSDD